MKRSPREAIAFQYDRMRQGFHGGFQSIFGHKAFGQFLPRVRVQEWNRNSKIAHFRKHY